MKKRPTGITILAVIFLIMGLLSLVWSGVVFGFGSLNLFFGSIFGADAMAAYGGSSVWAGVLGLAAAGVKIVVAIGLLYMKQWAWYLSILAVALTLVEGIFGVFSGGIFAFICGGIGLIIPILIFIYLLRPHIRKLFGLS
ncbi:MAG TPA: hypothetical protein EYP41_07670 [Anaerolineae bacterium]|nr:hypothetical protein [Anaerolineae bacterium]HIP70980.1 hypothetical protein [Anaerolineae bacterium]